MRLQDLPLLEPIEKISSPQGGWTARSWLVMKWRLFMKDERGIDPVSLFLVSIALQVVGYLLAPTPRAPAPPSAEDIQAPTSEAGRPIPILWGDSRIKGPNVGHFTDKSTNRRMVRIRR